MKILLLIPSVLKGGIEASVAQNEHPQMDYFALRDGLARDPQNHVDILDYSSVLEDTSFDTRNVLKVAGKDAALAWMGFQCRRNYDVIFTNGENVGIPLAVLMLGARARPRHVMIGHRLTTGKKRLFFTKLKIQSRIDTIFVYSSLQNEFATSVLGIKSDQIKLIPFHADHRFYSPEFAGSVRDNQICSAGLEWRDYPTLISAVESKPDLAVRLAAASPWSKHTNETENRALPANIDARRYDYKSLRSLYGESAFVVVPLYENDFQAGVTTILEAMAMGKAVIASRTSGQTDVIRDGTNGLTVPPGDVAALNNAITSLLENSELAVRLGNTARQWILENATLNIWVDNVSSAILGLTEEKTIRPEQSTSAAAN